jgi:arabinogalactan endo-1,4-beta-galactosidase
MKKYVFLIALIALWGCSQDEGNNNTPGSTPFFIKGADASVIPEIRQHGFTVYNSGGTAEDMLVTLKNAGVNTIRLRLWHNPATGHSGFNEVKAFAAQIRQSGLKVLLTVHYSDTWADPAQQEKPAAWQQGGLQALQDSVYNYTAAIAAGIKPDYIQIGNEINNGFLWPQGSYNNLQDFKNLLARGIQAVRDNSGNTKIILHYAGHENAPYFFNQMAGLNYDIAGISYYTQWHGKDLNALKSSLIAINTQTGKETLIAETAYPFTFEWNDYTNNLIGNSSQVIDAFPATPQGQEAYLAAIRQITQTTAGCKGFCYWGGEWIAFKGNTATNGSAVENTAFWGFDNKALPVLNAYNN